MHFNHLEQDQVHEFFLSYNGCIYILIFMLSYHHILTSFSGKLYTYNFFFSFSGSSCISTGVYCSCQTMVENEMIEGYYQLLDHSLIIRGFSFFFE